MSSAKDKKPLKRRWHKRVMGRVAACIALCAVAACAFVTGVGYGLGWFDDQTVYPGEETVQPVDSQDSAAYNASDANDEFVQDQDADTALTDEEAILDDDPGNNVEIVDAGEASTAQEFDRGESSEENDVAGVASSESSSTLSQDFAESTLGDGSAQDTSSESTNNSTSANISDTQGSSGFSSKSGASAESSDNVGSSGAASSERAGTSNNATSDTSGKADTDNGSSLISVSVYIDSSRAAPYGWPACLGDMTVSIAAGSSVYDALKATGLAIGGTSSYVSSIAGLAEKACGGGSGWLYYVNGVSPGGACSKYILNGGESITWIYTCDMGNDV